MKECIKETRKRKIEVGDDEVREFCLWNLYFFTFKITSGWGHVPRRLFTFVILTLPFLYI